MKKVFFLTVALCLIFVVAVSAQEQAATSGDQAFTDKQQPGDQQLGQAAEAPAEKEAAAPEVDNGGNEGDDGDSSGQEIRIDVLEKRVFKELPDSINNVQVTANAANAAAEKALDHAKDEKKHRQSSPGKDAIDVEPKAWMTKAGIGGGLGVSLVKYLNEQYALDLGGAVGKGPHSVGGEAHALLVLKTSKNFAWLFGPMEIFDGSGKASGLYSADSAAVAGMKYTSDSGFGFKLLTGPSLHTEGKSGGGLDNTFGWVGEGVFFYRFKF